MLSCVFVVYFVCICVCVTEYNEEPVVQLGVGCGIVECHLVANDGRDLISISVEPETNRRVHTRHFKFKQRNRGEALQTNKYTATLNIPDLM